LIGKWIGSIRAKEAHRCTMDACVHTPRKITPLLQPLLHFAAAKTFDTISEWTNLSFQMKTNGKHPVD
jgi:hypothetical protein